MRVRFALRTALTAALLAATASGYTVSSAPSRDTVSINMDEHSSLSWTYYANNMAYGVVLYSEDPRARFTLVIDDNLEAQSSCGYDWVRHADEPGGVAHADKACGGETTTLTTRGPAYYLRLGTDSSVTYSWALSVSWSRADDWAEPPTTTTDAARCAYQLEDYCVSDNYFDYDQCATPFSGDCAVEVASCAADYDCSPQLVECFNDVSASEHVCGTLLESAESPPTFEAIAAYDGYYGTFPMGNYARHMLQFYLSPDQIEAGAYQMTVTVWGGSVEDCCDKWILRDEPFVGDEWTSGSTDEDSLSVGDGDAWVFIDTDYSVTSTYAVSIDVVYSDAGLQSSGCSTSADLFYPYDVMDHFPLEQCTQGDCDKAACGLFFNLCAVDSTCAPQLWTTATATSDDGLASDSSSSSSSSSAAGTAVGVALAVLCGAGWVHHKRQQAKRRAAPSPQVRAFQESQAAEARAAEEARREAAAQEAERARAAAHEQARAERAAQQQRARAVFKVTPTHPQPVAAQLPSAAALPQAQTLPMAVAVPIASAAPFPAAVSMSPAVAALPVAQAIHDD